MGFWSNFLGSFVGNVCNDIQKQNRENKKWNDLFFEISDYEAAFNNFLASIGCIDSYTFDVASVDSGNITYEKRKIDECRKKVNEYLSLGGKGKYIHHIEEIDDCLKKINILNKAGCIDRQDEFGYDFAEDVEEKLREENNLLFSQQNDKIFSFNLNTDDESIFFNDMNQLSGIEFEKVCQQLVENMGFETQTTKASGDGGIDLIAYNYQPLVSGKYIIQCKRYTGSVGEPIIRDLYGVVTAERANKGILITTGHFTKSAISFAEGKPIELIDGKQLKDLFEQYNGDNIKVHTQICDDENNHYLEMLKTLDFNDFENVCMQYIQYKGDNIISLISRDVDHVILEAENEITKDIRIYIFLQEIEDVFLIDILNIFNVFKKDFEDCDVSFWMITTGNYDETCKTILADYCEVWINGNQFLTELKDASIAYDNGIRLKTGLVAPDKVEYLNDMYSYMKRQYNCNKNDLTAQLAFIEVLHDEILDIWFKDAEDGNINELISDYDSVRKNIVTENENINYMLLYIYSDVLICQGKTKAAVEVYYNLLNWDLLVNSISYSNCMEEMYLGVVYNLYQLLLMERRSLEAKQVYDEHYAVIQYALEDYKTQLNFAKVENDLKMIEQWESAYDILEHGKIGFIYIPEGLNGYMYNAVHESISYRSMIRERLENINSNEAVYLDIFMDSLNLEEREDGYYIQKKNGMQLFEV